MLTSRDLLLALTRAILLYISWRFSVLSQEGCHNCFSVLSFDREAAHYAKTKDNRLRGNSWYWIRVRDTTD
jgi:hypothetical protein